MRLSSAAIAVFAYFNIRTVELCAQDSDALLVIQCSSKLEDRGPFNHNEDAICQGWLSRDCVHDSQTGDASYITKDMSEVGAGRTLSWLAQNVTNQLFLVHTTCRAIHVVRSPTS